MVVAGCHYVLLDVPSRGKTAEIQKNYLYVRKILDKRPGSKINIYQNFAMDFLRTWLGSIHHNLMSVKQISWKYRLRLPIIELLIKPCSLKLERSL